MIGMFRRLFDWKLHGFRVVDIFGVAWQYRWADRQ